MNLDSPQLVEPHFLLLVVWLEEGDEPEVMVGDLTDPQKQLFIDESILFIPRIPNWRLRQLLQCRNHSRNGSVSRNLEISKVRRSISNLYAEGLTYQRAFFKIRSLKNRTNGKIVQLWASEKAIARLPRWMALGLNNLPWLD